MLSSLKNLQNLQFQLGRLKHKHKVTKYSNNYDKTSPRVSKCLTSNTLNGFYFTKIYLSTMKVAMRMMMCDYGLVWWPSIWLLRKSETFDWTRCTANVQLAHLRGTRKLWCGVGDKISLNMLVWLCTLIFFCLFIS